MVVEVDGFVLGEQIIEGVLGQCVGVQARGSQNHQISNIHNAYAKIGRVFAEGRSRCDDFKGNFDANTDENNIRVDSIINAGGWLLQLRARQV